MERLKKIVTRGAALAMAVGFAGAIGASYLPSGLVSADSLNPLTKRSLTLSSSSPGWSYTDGSGNSTYAPPNSGANGQKTGESFAFDVSSNATIKAFTFQFCTAPAGECQAPGDNPWTTGTGTVTTDTASTTLSGSGTDFVAAGITGGDKIVTAGGQVLTVQTVTDGQNIVLTAKPATVETGVTFHIRKANSATKSDLNVATSSPAEVGPSDFNNVVNTVSGDVKAVPDGGVAQTVPHVTKNNIAGNYVVYYDNSAGQDGTSWAQSTGWTMSASNKEETTTEVTGQNNYITLANTSGQALAPGQRVKVVFFGEDANYITNPGSGAFFVKINDYNSDTLQDDTTLVDGGVTVANVMNFSIAISTKVLETMDFSVGTVDPDMLSDSELSTATSGAVLAHGQCNSILNTMNKSDLVNFPINTLKLGNPDAEYSLSTSKTYATHSYWRLSSNASAGATVYYSGVTLSNTENDQIAPIGATAAAPQVGQEQFGLALATSGSPNYDTDYSVAMNNDVTPAPSQLEYGADQSAAAYPNLDAGWTPGVAGPLLNAHTATLSPLVPEPNYGGGAGIFDASEGAGGQTIDSAFAFDPTSNAIPVALASENDQVVNCVTGKMRYIGNIAATTPAGIYTTKINYIAAPQY